ncbi:MAG: NAD(P)H-dependent oxidoreductase subunit E [Planctomycetes bacterium]|nr:NAD(P)H-dependent oxidoreductase subunit E [Planctomycetota bacterium]
MTKTLSKSASDAIDHLASEYPTKKSALLPALRVIESEFGCIDEEGMMLVADKLDVDPAHVFGVVTFYTHFKRPNHGRHRIMVCSTLSCDLAGSSVVTDTIEKTIGIKVGQRTADGRFSLEKVECLASCGTAPSMQIDDKHFENLTPVQVEKIIRSYIDGNPIDPDKDRGGYPH